LRRCRQRRGEASAGNQFSNPSFSPRPGQKVQYCMANDDTLSPGKGLRLDQCAIESHALIVPMQELWWGNKRSGGDAEVAMPDHFPSSAASRPVETLHPSPMSAERRKLSS
jgi:hypothetical protein